MTYLHYILRQDDLGELDSIQPIAPGPRWVLWGHDGDNHGWNLAGYTDVDVDVDGQAWAQTWLAEQGLTVSSWTAGEHGGLEPETAVDPAIADFAARVVDAARNSHAAGPAAFDALVAGQLYGLDRDELPELWDRVYAAANDGAPAPRWTGYGYDHDYDHDRHRRAVQLWDRIARPLKQYWADCRAAAREVELAAVRAGLRTVIAEDEALVVRAAGEHRRGESWQTSVARLLAELLYPPSVRPPTRDDEIVTVTAPDGRTLDVAVRLRRGDPTAADLRAEVDADVEAAADLWAAGLRSRQPDGHGYVCPEGDVWSVAINRWITESVDIDASDYDEQFPEVAVHGSYQWIDDDVPHDQREDNGMRWWPDEHTRDMGWGAGWYARP